MDLAGQNLGQYRIVEPVGAGGMATVYKAFQPGLDRYVAVKVLPAQHALTPGFKERFFREAKAVAQLSHPNILPIYDVGIENDISYFVMKYVPGRTLKDVMGQSLPAEAVCDYMDQLAGALDHAHTRGILHRDIKPVNVLLEDDWLLLADFGLAKIVEGTEALTATGSSMGTPAYVSPEQAVGKPVDHHTDIYSLGVVLYEMATGQVPYSGETPMGVMFEHVYEPLPIPRQVNPGLSEAVERVILKALAKDPDDRFDQAGELARTLREAVETGTTETVISTAPIVAAPGAQPPRDEPGKTVAQQPGATSPNIATSGSAPTGAARRPLWVWLGLAAVVVVLLGGAAVLVTGLGSDPSTSRRLDLIIAEAGPGNGSTEAGVAELAAEAGEADTAAAPEAAAAIAAAPPTPTEAAAEAVAAAPPAPTGEPAQAVAAEAAVSSPSPEPAPTTPTTGGSSSVASGPRSFDEVPSLTPSILLGRGPINDMAVKPNGQSLAVASSTGVWLYELPDLDFIRQLEGSGSRISSVAWSPDGRQVAAGTAAGPVHIWDAGSGTEVLRLEGHTTEAISVAWSPDGTRLAAGSEAATIRIWDAGDGRELVELFGHLYEPYSLAWAPEGTQIASASRDMTIRIWDVASGGELHRLEGHLDEVNSVDWSPDGTQLLSSSDDLTIRVWATDAWQEENILSGHTGAVVNAAWSPDGTRIVSGGFDGTVRLWDADSGEELRRLEGHSQPGVTAAWITGGKQIVSGGLDGTVRVWDVDSEVETARLSGHTGLSRDVAWSPDGTTLAVVGFDGAVHLWSIDDQQEVRTISTGGSFLLGVTWSPDGRQVATGNTDGIVKIWDVDNGQEISALTGHADAVSRVAWSPDGQQLASGSADGTVRLWDTVSGARLRELTGHEDAVNGLAWSPDGTELASGGDDRVVIIWNAGSGAEVRRLEGRTALEVYQYHYAARGPNWIKSVAWSPDGKRLAAGSSDFVSRIWDPASGAELRLLEGPEVPVLSVAWASDSRHLALTGVGGRHSITVWNAMKDQPLYQLGGHVDTVYGLDWSPDGNRLASVGNDGVIHVWEVPLE